MQFVVSLILSTVALGYNAEMEKCQKHPIYCSIKAINNKVDDAWAMEISNHLHKYSKRYNTDPMISVAIIAQESMFRNVHRKQDIVLFYEECDEDNVCVEYTKLATGYTDVGLYQFHARTIQAYGMDALRLRDDIEYATERHAFLLSEKLRECSRLGKEAWSCYHSATPHFRKKYVRMVGRYLDILIEKGFYNEQSS